MNDIAEVEILKVSPTDEAVALIDERLAVLSERALVSASEVTDILLDVRGLLSHNS